MCLESCFECQDPCWPRDELPAAPPAAGYLSHSEPLSKQVFERSDDAHPAGRKLQVNSSHAALDLVLRQENKIKGNIFGDPSEPQIRGMQPRDTHPAGRKLQDIPIYEKHWYAVGD